MAALAASPHNALPPPSWDETIVPSLRKRLESESRILTKRLSTISITDEGPPPDPPQSTRRAIPPPQNHVGESSNATGSYSHRPSAIPRPSHSRNGERAAASPSPPPQPAETSRKAGSKRQRTQSTPFPFNFTPSSSVLPNGNPANAMPTPSSSGSISTRVQSPPLGRTTPTPSRIPTVSSRVRSGSQSSQGFGSFNGKASLPPSHKFSPSETTSVESDSQSRNLRVEASSSSLARQRIVDERPPFNNDPSPKVLESEFTGRPSSDEERPFQHWYRGDVSRNGGVGEYRVGRRMEMLDIANFGHTIRKPAGRSRPYEEPAPRSENVGVAPRKRAESVSSRERASVYIDPQDEIVIGRVLDETPLTDIEADETDYERDRFHPLDPSTEFDVQQEYSPVLLPHDHRVVTSSSVVSSAQIPSSTPQPQISQTQTNTQRHTATVAPTINAERMTPAKASRRRVHAPPSGSQKPIRKPEGQKRSKSAVDAPRMPPEESSDYAGLADAVPETRSPLPRNGNWDEVILPTVARRMGIEYDKEDPVVVAKRRARESRVAPAPGTFGYDHTKYKPPRTDEELPMGEFGQRQDTPQPQEDHDPPLLAAAPEEPREDPVRQVLRPRRETMPSPAPFSHYASPPDVANVDQQASTGKIRRKERQDVPHILVSPPTMEGGDKALYVEEGRGAGCCKCVVM